jgi:hypothetical protein
MKFIAINDTPDGRIKQAKIYIGTLVIIETGELRVCVFDSRGQWTAFHPSNFVPGEMP